MAAPGGAHIRDTQLRLPKVTKVKNKQPANRQITAEQILREAKEIQLEDDYKVSVAAQRVSYCLQVAQRQRFVQVFSVKSGSCPRVQLDIFKNKLYCTPGG